MFDFDQDVEILELIQVVNNVVKENISYNIFLTKLPEALGKVIEKYGSEILTYKGV